MSKIEKNTIETHDLPLQDQAVENTHSEVETHGSNTDESVLASLGLNGQLFAFQLLNFAIVTAIIWFLILKPLTKKMEERKKLIDESIKNARQVDTKLQMSELKCQEKIDEAKAEANKILEKASKDADVLRTTLQDNARAEIEGLVNQAKDNIIKEKEMMIQEIKEETVNLVMLSVEKIIEEKMDSNKDKAMIEDSLKGLKEI